MVNNLVKEGVERNSQRIIEAIRSMRDAGDIAADFINEGIEGFIELTENPDSSLTVRITEERPERAVEELREEDLFTLDTIILTYENFVAEINNNGLISFLLEKEVISEGENVYLEHSEALVLVYSPSSLRNYYIGLGFKPFLTKEEIITNIKDRYNAGILLTNIRERVRVI